MSDNTHSRFYFFLRLFFFIFLMIGTVYGIYLFFFKPGSTSVKTKAQTSGVILSFIPSIVTAANGDNFTVTIAMNTNDKTVSAAELHLTYDKTKLQGESITASTFLPVVLTPGTIGTGVASITVGAQPSSPQKGNGIIASITFKSISSLPSQIIFTNNTKVAAINETIDVVAEMDTATVNETSSPIPTTPVPPIATLTPTRTPTHTPTPIPPTPTHIPTPTPTSTIVIHPTATPAPPIATLIPTRTPTHTPTLIPPTPTHIPTPTPTSTIVIHPTPTPPNSQCKCGPINVCSSNCVFNKFEGVNYPISIKCSLSTSLFATTPSADNKTSWCLATKRTKGDADGNGIINNADYFYYVAAANGGKIPVTVNPDFNGDGEVGLADRTIVVKSLNP